MISKSNHKIILVSLSFTYNFEKNFTNHWPPKFISPSSNLNFTPTYNSILHKSGKRSRICQAIIHFHRSSRFSQDSYIFLTAPIFHVYRVSRKMLVNWRFPKWFQATFFESPILSLRLVNELLIKKKNLIQTTYFEENANIIFTYLSIARDIIRLFNQWKFLQNFLKLLQETSGL